MASPPAWSFGSSQRGNNNNNNNKDIDFIQYEWMIK